MILTTGRRQNLLKNKNGFTLVELLLVVIILGILSGIAIPSFRKTYLNLELSNTADTIAYLMRFAQARAVTQRTNYRLIFNSELNNCWLEKEISSDPSQFEKVSSKFARSVVIPEDIKVESELKIINFYPNGKIDEAKIYLKNQNDKTYTVCAKGQVGHVEVSDFAD